jgi:phage-related protein
MPRSYFIFNGVDSRSKGILLRHALPVIRPEERIKHVAIPGRAGDLTELEGEEVYEPYIQTVALSVKGTKKEETLKWLQGEGYFITSAQPTLRQSARVIGAVTLDKVSAHLDWWQGQVQFYCQPLKEAATQESNIEITSSPGTVTNPGDVKSKPLIQINGSGSITLIAGGQTLILTGVASGWKIDAETGWILNASGEPQYGVCQGIPEKIRFPVGNSAVQWTGSVTKLIITPRWRYL